MNKIKNIWKAILAYFVSEKPKLEAPKNTTNNKFIVGERKSHRDLFDFSGKKYKNPEDSMEYPSFKSIPYHLLVNGEVDSGLTFAQFSEEVGGFENNNFKPIEIKYSPEGTMGLPWNSGVLRIETHSDLMNMQGRGRNGIPGLYWQLSQSPPVTERLNQIISPIVAAPWRLQRPPKPEQLELIPEWETQCKYQEEVFDSWKEVGKKYDLTCFIYDVLKVSLVSGFYLGECFLDSRGKASIPSLRAPWTVDEWIFSGENPRGFLQTSRVYDNRGASSPYRKLISLDKCVHVANNQVGASDLEGTSIIRPAYEYLMILQDLYQLQALSASLNATGTWVGELESGVEISTNAINDLQDFFANYEAKNPPYVIAPAGIKIRLESPDSAVVDLSSQIEVFKQAAYLAMGGQSTLIGLDKHGSYALKSESESSQRDLLDSHALKVSKAIEQALRIYVGWEYPEANKLYVCEATWGQIEQRDNQTYLDSITKYISIRDRLWTEAQEVLDVMLDLPKHEATDVPVEAPESPVEPSVE